MAKKKALNIDFKKLKEEFKDNEIDWRIVRCGVKDDSTTIWAFAAPFITARALHDRLDEVCGPENWQSRYKEHLGETVCEIGIRTDNGWIWKSGGSERTSVEAFKGGLSTAEKRAGVPWGIGRYLYSVDEVSVVTANVKQNTEQWRFQPANEERKIPAFCWKLPVQKQHKIHLINIYQFRELIQEAKKTGCPVMQTLNGMAKAVFHLEKITDLHEHRFDEALKWLRLKKKMEEKKAQGK